MRSRKSENPEFSELSELFDNISFQTDRQKFFVKKDFQRRESWKPRVANRVSCHSTLFEGKNIEKYVAEDLLRFNYETD